MLGFRFVCGFCPVRGGVGVGFGAMLCREEVVGWGYMVLSVVCSEDFSFGLRDEHTTSNRRLRAPQSYGIGKTRCFF